MVEVWETRNEVVHGKTKTEKQHKPKRKRKRKLAEQIRELQKEKEYVRPRDDHIFQKDPEEFIERSSPNHLENWLRIYRSTIFNSKKEAEKTMSNKIKRITKYLKTTQGYDKRHRQRERTKAEKLRHDAYPQKEKEQETEHAPNRRLVAEYITVHITTDRLILT